MEAAVNNLPQKIRVLIADDHRMFAEALEAILGTDERLEVAGQAADGAEAVRLPPKPQPGVIFMGISMPGMDGGRGTQQNPQQWPTGCILMVTRADPEERA